MMNKLNGCIFWLKMITCSKNIILFGIKKEFESEPVYNNKFLKTKIKSYGDEVTDFCNEKIPKVDSNHTCLAVISLDSAVKKDGNYYLQVSLKEYKYIQKKLLDIVQMI